MPRHDLYIEKSTDINEQIERLRLSATASLFLAPRCADCGVGVLHLRHRRSGQLAENVGRAQGRRYGGARARAARFGADSISPQRPGVAPRHFPRAGDTLEIVPGYSETAFRIYLWGDEIEKIVEFHPLTGEVVHVHEHVTIFPAREYITDEEHIREALHDIELELEEQIKLFQARRQAD